MHFRWFIGICLLLFLTACGEEKVNDSSTDETDTTQVKPEVNPEPIATSDRIVFFEIVNPGLGKVYNLHSQSLIDGLHGKYCWPGEGDTFEEYPADSSLESLLRDHPGQKNPYVHKFFSVTQVNELRFGDVVKIRMTWEKNDQEDRLKARFKLYRNQDHKWTAYGNPGSFDFPSEEVLPVGSDLPGTEEQLALVRRTLVLLTYK